MVGLESPSNEAAAADATCSNNSRRFIRRSLRAVDISCPSSSCSMLRVLLLLLGPIDDIESSEDREEEEEVLVESFLLWLFVIVLLLVLEVESKREKPIWRLLAFASLQHYNGLLLGCGFVLGFVVVGVLFGSPKSLLLEGKETL